VEEWRRGTQLEIAWVAYHLSYIYTTSILHCHGLYHTIMHNGSIILGCDCERHSSLPHCAQRATILTSQDQCSRVTFDTGILHRRCSCDGICTMILTSCSLLSTVFSPIRTNSPLIDYMNVFNSILVNVHDRI
jgi:hypothetical protein